MPILQYRCVNCGKEFEELVKSFRTEIFCPVCGERAERSYSGEVF
ncbi:MAG: zinc ribbon domain-containing protein, partial [Clostridia bacterium]|nr:zinc ribbon domain-containing protein [Clostridia bacterium]